MAAAATWLAVAWQRRHRSWCFMRFTIGAVLLILVVGILIGLALAEWLIGAAAAIGVALIVVAVALVAFFTIRRRIRAARAERARDR
jgi:uncharacterized membrane protein